MGNHVEQLFSTFSAILKPLLCCEIALCLWPLAVLCVQFDLMLSTDGSGRGAALVAAVLKSQAAILKR